MRQQKVPRDRVACADDKAAHLQRARLGKLVFARFQKSQSAADIIEQQPPVVCQRDAAGRAQEEPRLQAVLQLADGLAHRRLGDEQILRSLGKITRLRNLAEDAV